MARTAPDRVVTYIGAFELDKLIDANNLHRFGHDNLMKVAFSLLMERWIKQMHIKHADDPYMFTHLYTTHDFDRGRYRLEAVYR